MLLYPLMEMRNKGLFWKLSFESCLYGVGDGVE
jgi:hypothetical protein